jgi:PAS domain S-box-containing protein
MASIIKQDLDRENDRIVAEPCVPRGYGEGQEALLEPPGTFVDSVSAPLFVVDRDLVVTAVNDSALKTLGFRREELLHRMICAGFCEDPGCVSRDCMLEYSMRTGRTVLGESVAETRNGQRFPVGVACSAVFDSRGEVMGGIKMVFDRMDGVQPVLEAEYILEYLNAPVFVVDRDLVVTAVNDPALKALGFKREELLHKITCAGLYRASRCDMRDCMFEYSMSRGRTVIGREEAETRDGRRLLVEAACVPLFDRHGKVYGGVKILTDLKTYGGFRKETLRGQCLSGQVARLAGICRFASSLGGMTGWRGK